jgi:hypothetical protein
MTNEQVKEILKHELVEMIDRYGGDYSGVEAMKIAIQCVDLDIPKKAVQAKLERTWPDYSYNNWVCPTCGDLFAPEHSPYLIPKRCKKCGQKIAGYEVKF